AGGPGAAAPDRPTRNAVVNKVPKSKPIARFPLVFLATGSLGRPSAPAFAAWPPGQALPRAPRQRTGGRARGHRPGRREGIRRFCGTAVRHGGGEASGSNRTAGFTGGPHRGAAHTPGGGAAGRGVGGRGPAVGRG